MTVTIKPMPDFYRHISKRWRPQHPPIFTDCGKSGPSQEERELARELFKILDAESQEWYGRRGIFKGID
jgi:hypothetical protein